MKIVDIELIEGNKYLCTNNNETYIVSKNLNLINMRNDEDVKHTFNLNELLNLDFEEVIDKSDKWDIKEGESYWIVNQYGKVSPISMNNNDCYDKLLIENANACKDKEYMKREAFETTLRRKLKKFADINNDKEIDWNDNTVQKWCICRNNRVIKPIPRCHYSYFGQVYFSSKEICEKAIEEFRYELEEYFEYYKK